MNFYTPATWGYNMFFYLAASNDCHPNYVSYLMDKRTLSVKSINEILGRLQGEKQLLYDQKYIEDLYREYQMIEIDDSEDRKELKKIFSNSNILLLGPGKSIEKQKEKIQEYIQQNRPIVISVNFLDDEYPTDYLFLSNSKRYVQLATALTQKDLNVKIIATSNVTKTSGKFDYVLKYSNLIDENAEVIDNSFMMLLNALTDFEVESVATAGFDGYATSQQGNYIRPYMEYNFDENKFERLNEYVKTKIFEIKKILDVKFLTKSLYTEEIAD